MSRLLPAVWLAALVGLSSVPRLAAAEPPAKAEAPKADAPKADAPKKVAAKPAAKPKGAKPGAKSTKSSKKPQPKRTRKAGEPGKPDESARRVISGAAVQPGSSTAESTELRAMREIDQALFPSAAPSPGPAWLAEGTVLVDPGGPRVDASGEPPSALLAPPAPAEGASPAPAPVTRDLSWLRQLEMPDIPVRWDARVVRYLEHYKNDPRGRSAAVIFLRKSGRYGGAIRRVLRENKLPEDIMWLALVESGFEPTAQSPVGAAGLWQFMPEGARIYGLTVDRWIDERLDPERSTLAAARYLSDLRQRFGTWELAFAAYNMGYGGLLAAIRKYNTNDFWELSRLEAGLPLETALYVPKIIAIAIVARNRKVFGVEDVELDPAVGFDKVAVTSGVSLQAVATAAGAPPAAVEELNPQLVARRTPPQPLDAKDLARWEVRVPPGAGAQAAKAMPRVLEREPKLERHVVRWGESLEDIAAARGASRSSLAALNGLRPGEAVRPGTLLLVPAGAGAAASAEPASAPPVIAVPAQRFAYEDRRRVFYRVVPGDTLRDLAAVLGISEAELCRWNALDPGAALQDGMSLQAWVPRARRYDQVLLLEEAQARVLEVGSDEFFATMEAHKGRKRLEIVAREGDDWRKLSRRYGLSLGMLERINHRSRRSAIQPGEKVVVYVPLGRPDDPVPEPPREAEVTVAATSPSGDDDDAVKPAVLRREVEGDADEADPADAPPSPPGAPPSSPGESPSPSGASPSSPGEPPPAPRPTDAAPPPAAPPPVPPRSPQPPPPGSDRSPTPPPSGQGA